LDKTGSWSCPTVGFDVSSVCVLGFVTSDMMGWNGTSASTKITHDAMSVYKVILLQ